MSDNIFNEIDDEVRRERLKQLWDRYGLYAIVLAFIVVAGIGGWRGYEYWQDKKAAESGAAFEAATALSDQGKFAEAEAAFLQIAKDGTPSYQTLARFRAIAAEGQRDPKKAVASYDELAAGPIGSILQDLANVRAGYLLVDTAPLDEMRRRLDPLTEPGRPFRHSARELLALSAWKNADTAALKRYVEMVTNDAETPQSTRARIDVLAALAAADGKS